MSDRFANVYNQAQGQRFAIVYPAYMEHITLNDRAKNDTEDTNLFYFTIDKKYARHLYDRLTALGVDILDIEEAEIAIETSADYQILAATIGIVEYGSVVDLDDINGDFELLKALVKREVENENGHPITNEAAVYSVLSDEDKSKFTIASVKTEIKKAYNNAITNEDAVCTSLKEIDRAKEILGERMDEIANNLVVYMNQTDIISNDEKDKLINDTRGESIEATSATKLMKCFEIICTRCNDITTEREFFNVLELEVGITPGELEIIKAMNLPHSSIPVMTLPEFIDEEMER